MSHPILFNAWTVANPVQLLGTISRFIILIHSKFHGLGVLGSQQIFLLHLDLFPGSVLHVAVCGALMIYNLLALEPREKLCVSMHELLLHLHIYGLWSSVSSLLLNVGKLAAFH